MKNFSYTYSDYYVEFNEEGFVDTSILKQLLSTIGNKKLENEFRKFEELDSIIDKCNSFDVDLGYVRWLETYKKVFNKDKEIEINDKGFWKKKNNKFISLLKEEKNKDFILLEMSKNSPVSDFISFDVETTGLNTELDSIIQISAVKYKNNAIVDKFDYFIIPSNEKEITPLIESITGITNEILKKEGRNLKEILPLFFEFIEDLPLVGHNLKFDINMLDSECNRLNIELIGREYYDTYLASKKILPYLGRGNYKLEKLKERLPQNISSLDSHNSLNDCIICGEFFLYLQNIIQ